MKRLRFWCVDCVAVVLLLLLSGCDKQQATETLNEAGSAVEDAGEGVANKAGEIAKQGEQMAGDVKEEAKQMADQLSEKAAAFVAPLKEKFGDLDNLKDSPEKLKTAVSDLITSIEEKAEGIELPESMKTALATVKEKLVKLRDYLEGEYEQSKIDEYVKSITDTVKSAMGTSKE